MPVPEDHNAGAERAPHAASGEEFIAHTENIPPHIPESSSHTPTVSRDEETIKQDLWHQVINGYQSAHVSQSEIARHINMSQSEFSRFVKRGINMARRSTLERYLNGITG